MTKNNFKSLFLGQDFQVPILGNQYIRYVDLDNAATSPPFIKVVDKVNEFSKLYSSIHRGNGFKSLCSTEIYQEARNIVANFVEAEPDKNTVVFVKNSTEAINKLASLFTFNEEDIILTSFMEHHSNDLPWRKHGIVKNIDIKTTGEIDIDHFKNLVHQYGKRIKLVAITGASNVTGYINPIYDIATMAHEIGAKVLVDASQLAPHRKIDIKRNMDIKHIDFLVFTAHKLFAPFGTGVLVGPNEFFEHAEPDHVGGGMVKMVTSEEVYWDEVPERNEAGTPNVMGAVALAVSIKNIEAIGYGRIEKHEMELTQYLVEGLKEINHIDICGGTSFHIEHRLGVVSFNVENMHHSLVAAILSYEYGIGVRSGCFCAHPYVLRLLNVDSDKVNRYKNSILNGDKSNVPGLVRVSLGLQNNLEDIDRLLMALKNITAGIYSDCYVIDKHSGNYSPKGWTSNFHSYFSFS
ncbi:selenocysteine lyase/cysteine desulfurase [Anaerosolibacter carboniphilus]|uniref:Selenocysteine lyase/cysteine desulfurase n=1 Tax=Anaerosolibacter carboniphilus TaxID=1417629 RepID=A0A841KPV3_9FIRM|nr:selenocysteine lyase/cysteine desulfurase [Anaerosolibacter carboniphilus]